MRLFAKSKILIFSLVLMCISGCYRKVKCGSVETCNYLDDDCDGLIDEDFKDANGKYSSVHNCGGCGINCRDVFPTADDVACVVENGHYVCKIVSCPEGYHLSGSGACLPEASSLCLPCEDDYDCAIFEDGAKCMVTNDGSLRCMSRCLSSNSCPAGFYCLRQNDEGVCFPASGYCSCTEETVGERFACLVFSSTGDSCAGYRECQMTERGPQLGDCIPAFEEICDGVDNDCDGYVDEDFIVNGKYVHSRHCGRCNNPCVPPGPHMIATCVEDTLPYCDVKCEENFVDIDGLSANGCECEYSAGSWPPSRLGVDADCDGEIDDSSEFIFVSPSGNDDGPGSLIFPMRTIHAAIERAVATGKTILVAWGEYEGPVNLAEGVAMFGGYSPDFSERDTSIYPVVIRNSRTTTGQPVVFCRGVNSAEMGGFVIKGSQPFVPATGSTAMYFDGCGPNVLVKNLIVYGGRPTDGEDGASSSENLLRWGMSSLMELNGVSGEAGRDGVVSSSPNCSNVVIPGGEGGSHFCPGSGNDVSGGDGGDAICPHTGCVSGLPCANAGCTDYTVDGVCDMETVLRLAVANPPAEEGSGPGGGSAGARTYDAVTNRFSCNFCDDNPTLRRGGDDGRNGMNGVDGAGGVGCRDGNGIFDYENGTWRASNGGDGEDGTDGGGGGGGTCGSGYDVIEGVVGCNDAIGGSGGGGGSGGCGAPRASGGTGGGCSIGIAVVLWTGQTFGPQFNNVHVVTAQGGKGGNGGIGADGGVGGAGGEGGQGTFWCTRRGGRGGDGGSGGAGGGGGGGCGGSVSGFHVISTTPSSVNYITRLRAFNSVDVLAPPGIGGRGGFSPGNSGEDGLDGTSIPFRLIVR